jgi:hypothetical protein
MINKLKFIKIKILLVIVLAFFNLVTSAQCLTRKHIDIANKVFEGNLKTSDFEGNLFLTVDTVNSELATVPSEYYEFNDPADLIKTFNKVMKSIRIEGTFFNYYESFNNSLYNSPLHQSFLVNSAKHTYVIDICNYPNDITKIEGLTIVKLNDKKDRNTY